MISPDFLQSLLLVQFSGGITYNPNGFAVLPEYTVVPILGSVQSVPSSEIRFLPEGTHYADFWEVFTDYNVDVDNTPTNLGDYFIWQTYVYKIYSAQNYKNFSNMSTNHIATKIARDNRLIYADGSLNLPYPEIDSVYVPLFELIAMVNSCFTSPTIPTLWGFQQELRPNFPFCMVNIEDVQNLEVTNHNVLNDAGSNQYQSISKALIVNFHFYAYDKIQAFTLMEKFKFNRGNYLFSSDMIGFAGFVDQTDLLNEELYENRTIFHGEVRLRFNFVEQQIASSGFSTIQTVIQTLNIQP